MGVPEERARRRGEGQAALERLHGIFLASISVRPEPWEQAILAIGLFPGLDDTTDVEPRAYLIIPATGDRP